MVFDQKSHYLQEIDGRNIVMKRVHSSNIRSIGYYERVLYVIFHSNRIYTYTPVEYGYYQAMAKSNSVGKSLNELKKDLSIKVKEIIE